MTLTAPPVPGTTVEESEKPTFFWMILWCLLVLGVQPWSSRAAAPQGTTGSTNSLMKGVLLGAIFLIVLAATRPGFRTRISPVTTLYVMYVLFASATVFLLADPVGPLLRLARLMVGLVLLFLLWRPLLQTPERLLRAHLWAHLLLAATIVASLAYAPGQAWRPLSAFGTGYRLQGVIIPMLPPRVGEVGAILLGLAIIAFVCRKLALIPATAFIGLGMTLIALSRTRTAAAAIAFGLFLALLLTRKTWFGRIVALGVPGLIGLLFMVVPTLHTWLVRGQGTRQITSLSGRTTSWQAVIDEEVSLQTAIIGHGLGNKRVLLRRGEGDIDVMAIDNSWLGLYWETGLLAVAIVGIAVIVAWVSVLRAPTPYVKACGALLLGYVTAASLNESGLSDLSSMTLHLLVAAAVCDSDRLRHRARLATASPPPPPRRAGVLPSSPPAAPPRPAAAAAARRSPSPDALEETAEMAAQTEWAMDDTIVQTGKRRRTIPPL
ncbi:O-antigen ligase [Kribbella amoyensis]|uniref:O-antigen ligase n=1 Tax=Kribbella amoyensis TaxID=996641 RepID=A0A561BWP2_9ACTN|nr:hypothetical protein [Kribbella amoyensis]TWD83300.1 O-antigen ligase [Kribbella amoyensis]